MYASDREAFVRDVATPSAGKRGEDIEQSKQPQLPERSKSKASPHTYITSQKDTPRSPMCETAHAPSNHITASHATNDTHRQQPTHALSLSLHHCAATGGSPPATLSNTAPAAAVPSYLLAFTHARTHKHISTCISRPRRRGGDMLESRAKQIRFTSRGRWGGKPAPG